MSEAAEGAGAGAGAARAYDIRQVLNALPHRYPLLLVDRVAALIPGETIHAVKAVSFNE
ncbi:MAG: 3-hydroxyacyl-[acyl-carrier-protein] dehydratase FabZ, partial [Novosphingobium sp.]|nr:3-hydroxyacyl-[acyl-carrier-protein] dehydratase FabZ [Novosphingobium sp.]